MKGFIVWLMGDKLGESTINGLNWLLEVPPDRSAQVAKTSGEITIEHASQLLELMRSKVLKIQNVVEQVRQSTQKNQHQYDLKCQYHQELIGMALESKRTGNIIEARLAMVKAIEIERILPDFKSKLDRSQDMLIGVNEIHAKKESELSLLEVDLEYTIASMAISDSVNDDRSPEQDRELMVLQAKLRDFLAETEDSYQQIQIMSQLSHPSACELGETLNTQDIDARIEELENIKDRTQDLGN
jgi:phage shock protein A